MEGIFYKPAVESNFAGGSVSIVLEDDDLQNFELVENSLNMTEIPEENITERTEIKMSADAQIEKEKQIKAKKTHNSRSTEEIANNQIEKEQEIKPKKTEKSELTEDKIIVTALIKKEQEIEAKNPDNSELKKEKVIEDLKIELEMKSMEVIQLKQAVEIERLKKESVIRDKEIVLLKQALECLELERKDSEIDEAVMENTISDQKQCDMLSYDSNDADYTRTVKLLKKDIGSINFHLKFLERHASIANDNVSSTSSRIKYKSRSDPAPCVFKGPKPALGNHYRGPCASPPKSASHVYTVDGQDSSSSTISASATELASATESPSCTFNSTPTATSATLTDSGALIPITASNIHNIFSAALSTPSICSTTPSFATISSGCGLFNSAPKTALTTRSIFDKAPSTSLNAQNFFDAARTQHTLTTTSVTSNSYALLASALKSPSTSCSMTSAASQSTESRGPLNSSSGETVETGEPILNESEIMKSVKDILLPFQSRITDIEKHLADLTASIMVNSSRELEAENAANRPSHYTGTDSTARDGFFATSSNANQIFGPTHGIFATCTNANQIFGPTHGIFAPRNGDAFYNATQTMFKQNNKQNKNRKNTSMKSNINGVGPFGKNEPNIFGIKYYNGCGTHLSKFSPTRLPEEHKCGVKMIACICQCITAMPEYVHKSIEELRLEDYSRIKPAKMWWLHKTGGFSADTSRGILFGAKATTAAPPFGTQAPVGPQITKKDTNWRLNLSALENLTITLSVRQPGPGQRVHLGRHLRRRQARLRLRSTPATTGAR